MAVEQDELKLTVALDDQASEQLGNLQKALSGIVTAAAPAAQGLNQLGQSLRGAGSHAQNLHSNLGGLAARGGLIGGFFFEVGRNVEKMAQDFAKATLDIKAYADAMVSLEVSASRASIGAAQFQRTISDMRASGIGAAEAAKNIQGFADALGDLQREQSRVRENLFAGLRGAEFEDMRRLMQRVQSSDRATALDEIKKFGDDIRAYWTSLGQAERGAAAQRDFYRQWGVPDIDKLREQLRSVTPELERMYAMRMGNAQSYQSSVEKTKDNWERSVRSVQATAFRVLPIRESAEAIAQFSEDISHWLESWEGAISDAGDELNKIQTSEGGFWESVFQQLGIAPTRTRGQEQREQEQREPADQPERPATFEERFPRGPSTWRIPTPGGPGGAAPQQFVGGGGLDTAAGPGGPVEAIPDIGKLLPGRGGGGGGPLEIGPTSGLSLEERMQRAGTPLSENILDLRNQPGAGGDEYERNTDQMAALATEVKRVNDIIIPKALKELIGGGPQFHNAPMGGAAGESNPIDLPALAPQPGGGAAAEARQPLLRPWRPGDPMTPTYPGKRGAPTHFPILSPAATPLPTPPGYNPRRPGTNVLTGVSEGRGVASWYGQGQGWGDKPSMDQPGSNALRVPEHLQGISLPSKETVGQFFYVTDPSTGLTHVRQQTDIGPGVRTQKLVDISVAAAQKEGYTKESFEAMQARVERGELKPWEVRSTGFGTRGTSTAPAPRGTVPTVETQNITQLPGGGADLPSGMDVEFNLFQQSGGPAQSTLDLPSGGGAGTTAEYSGEAADDPRRIQRALEGVQPGSDEEWELRKQQVLGGPGRSEFDPGPGPDVFRGGRLPAPGTFESTEAEMEEKLRQYKPEGNYDDPEYWEKGKRWGPAGEPINLDGLDTGTLDRAASQRVQVNQNGQLSVNVSAPEGTTVKAAGEGVFNKTETSRDIPMMQ